MRFVALVLAPGLFLASVRAQEAAAPLPARTFKLTANQVSCVFETSASADFLNQQGEIRNFLSNKGVILSRARDNLFFNDRTRELTVRASREQLNEIESILATIAQLPVVSFAVKLAEIAEDSLPEPLKSAEAIILRKRAAPQFQRSRSPFQPIDPQQLHQLGYELGFKAPDGREEQRMFYRVLAGPELQEVLEHLEAEPGSDLVKLPEIRAAHGKEIRLLSPAE